jgi:hypothetical protein
MNALESTSTRPYLIRALYEWCTDNGFTPYVAVLVDDTVQVPREYVKNGEIVLNISYDATSSLKLGNEFIESTLARTAKVWRFRFLWQAVPRRRSPPPPGHLRFPACRQHRAKRKARSSSSSRPKRAASRRNTSRPNHPVVHGRR